MKENRKKKRTVWIVFVAAVAGFLLLERSGTSNAFPKPAGDPEPVFHLNIDTSIASSVYTQYDMIQFFDRASLQHFYDSWKNTANKKLAIVHLGDSHLQSDIYPARIRKNLQKLKGDGGRGLVFPYSTAKTYSSIEYKSTHTGDWTYGKSLILPPKLPLGVIGMTSNTVTANASFTLTFDSIVPATYDKLRIYCKKSTASYDLQITTDSQIIKLVVDSTPGDSLPYYDVAVKPIGKSISIQTIKSNDKETNLEFYGMSMETSTNTGVILHNCGVGGAKYESILYEDLFDEQIPTLDPDLVIIDFGTNNYIYEDSLHPDLDTIVNNVIDKVRKDCPNASIILTSTQDMVRKGHDMVCGEKFSDLMRNIARKRKCGFFDWYWISGGRAKMNMWIDKGYAQPDGIHLGIKGYKLKGDLFTNAVLNTFQWMDQNPTGDSVTFNLDSIKTEQKKLLVVDSTWNNYSVAGTTTIRHKVTKGQTLGGIANKYGVSVAQIKRWNNLHSDMIHVGDVLIIHKPIRHH
ncbi:MAG TPA: LysM peptidoglycan-binding domain-containing protein [Bacteroidia bacterium]|jgi:hypothetical protein|nr:LysM peptidoglycan-binding domain-containing protein [Bacteroidia bacterium]